MAPPSSLLERMKRNPEADWTIADVKLVCDQHGLLFRQGKGGSHAHVKHMQSQELLTIPARRPIKSVYIRKLVRYIESEGATT